MVKPFCLPGGPGPRGALLSRTLILQSRKVAINLTMTPNPGAEADLIRCGNWIRCLALLCERDIRFPMLVASVF